jgi:hypothetical protein
MPVSRSPRVALMIGSELGSGTIEVISRCPCDEMSEVVMRSFVLAIVTAALFAIPTSAFSQGVEIGPGGVRVDPGTKRQTEGRSAVQAECKQLRKACLQDKDLGEENRGNCSKYQARCQ